MCIRDRLLLMQALIVAFILISVVLALDPPDFIAQLMGISWGALAGAFLAPFLYGLYWKGVTDVYKRQPTFTSFSADVWLIIWDLICGCQWQFNIFVTFFRNFFYPFPTITQV